jgi:N6-adenosine-specific RNA methylase IME4
VKRYRTIVADPPWHYEALPVGRPPIGAEHDGRTTPLPFASMTVGEIAALPVRDLADRDAHVYLWTTNRYLRDAFDVLAAWGFRYSQTLAWCKKPMGLGPGATFANTMEFVLVGKRGSLAPLRRWHTAWLQLPRTGVHSRKPEAFLDIVEQVSPGPYVELFARRDRLGWDTWGNESLGTAELVA